MLYRAALVHTFGAQSNRPYRKTILQLSILCIAAIASSFILATIAGEMPFLQPVQHPYSLAATIVFATQVIVLTALLAAGGPIARTYDSTFARWLLLLPIRSLRRWLILALPTSILAILTVTCTIWPLGRLWSQLGASSPVIGLCSFAGMLCALGLMHALPPRLRALRLVYIPYILYIQYSLLTALHTSHSYTPATLYAFGFVAMALGAAWPLSALYTERAIQARLVPRQVSVPLPHSWWLSNKVCRAKSWRISYLSGLVLCVSLCILGKKYLIDPATISLGVAVLLAACIADLRGLSRLAAPPEIVAIKGAHHFCTQQLITAMLVGVTFALVVYMSGTTISLVTAAILITGIATGLAVGSAMAPTTHDISGQFLASLSCLVLLTVLPGIPGLPDSPTLQAICYLCIASVLLCSTYIVEYKRNPYIWRPTL